MDSKLKRAKYGATAHENMKGKLPTLFPRIMGPNCMKYLQKVIDKGLAFDMAGIFHQTFAKEYGVKHCIPTPGCTPALAALAASFPFQPGDEIIVSAITDYGTVQGLMAENYIPVFADTEPDTVNISAATIEPCITDRTRAILVVHKTGLLCDMDEINKLAKKHDLIVYEDVCQAIFGEYKGRLAGTLSLAAGCSFDAEKTMGSDVGGCILTNDDDLAEKIRFIGQSRGAVNYPNFGRTHLEYGYAYRMPSCTGAVSLAQLEIARPNVAQRDKMARLLTKMLSEIPGIKPLPIPSYTTVYSCWMMGFSIVPEMFSCGAEKFAEELLEEGIPGVGLGKYYLMPEALLCLQNSAKNKIYPFSTPPASRDYTYDESTCPVAHEFLKNFIRWSTFSEKYTPEHCKIATEIVRRVADRNRV
jgi:dTDP-4-amino-4,6-dideoxygalactose transaminase